MSQQLITNKKSNRKSKKIIFVIEGEFDITKMSELPDHIVHYCISFLSTEETGYYFQRNYPLPNSRGHCELTEDEQRIVNDWRHNRPSKWFEKLLRSETELLWNTKYVPMLTKAFTKMPKAQIHHLTRLNPRCIYYDKLHSRASWIKRKIDFNNFKGDYRLECIETILLSKGLTFPHYNDQNHSLYLEPYNPENFVCKI